MQQQLKAIDEILSKQKTDMGIYKYPSSPSLVLHLGELDDKPKEYFERTKWEVTHKDALAKWVCIYIKNRMWPQAMMRKRQVKNTRGLRESKVRFFPFVKRKYKRSREQDYLQIREYGSTSDLDSKEEIKIQHVRPIGGNTNIQGRLVDTNPLIRKEQGL